MKAGDIIKGHQLKVGMRVQRELSGVPMQSPMIVYADGVYYKNPLYSDDDFRLIELDA